MIKYLNKFYTMLPGDKLNICFEKTYGGKVNRKLKKAKDVKNKIQCIEDDENAHSLFVENLYNELKCSEIEYESANACIKDIDCQNFQRNIIYCLKNFPQEYSFKHYISSDEFNSRVKKKGKFDEEEKKSCEPESTVATDILKEINVEGIHIEDINTDDIELNQGDIDQINEFCQNDIPTNKYIVSIKQQNETFYNIYPIYNITEGHKLIKVEREEFPDYGNINISPNSNISRNFKKYKRNPIWICTIDKNQLEEFKTSGTRYRISDEELVKKGNINEICNENIFQLVEIQCSNEELEKNMVNGSLSLEDEPNFKQIYIANYQYIYGPFEYEPEKHGRGYILNKMEDYIVNKYDLYANRERLDTIDIYIDDEEGSVELKLLYFMDMENCVYTEIDAISDEELMDLIKQHVNVKSTNLSRSEIKTVKSIFDKFVASNQLADLSQDRIKRASEIINKNQVYDLYIDDIRPQLQSDISKTFNENEKESEKETLNLEIEKLKNDKENLEYELRELKKSLQQEIKKKDEFSVKNSARMKNVEKIEKALEDKFANITSKYADVAFDGIIADKILNSALNWSRSVEEELDNSQICTKHSFQGVKTIKEFGQPSEIKQYIYDNIRKVRKYSMNDIINMMICVSQGFLTVFSGEPGVGKTSICNIISQVLGLSNDENLNRYVEVSVEKGWTSKKDFIGYYNPLTKTFDKNNKALFQAFKNLNMECVRGVEEFPYFILLDEANLSSMEYYWADFMNVCDFDKENRKINLGEDYIFKIPQTLRFLATINYDHTTENLSPRLLDRAWIISMNADEIGKMCSGRDMDIKSIIPYGELVKYFCRGVDNNNADYSKAISLYGEICEIFSNNFITISPRIHQAVHGYLKTGISLFEFQNNAEKYEIAVDYAVCQKLLPKISGVGEGYENFLSVLLDKCSKHNMSKSSTMLNRILEIGNRNMKYFEFFN
ncbi:hypothetical protein SAMN02745248_01537 [Hathewaya proteolytica DSM 3090]|uniref:AAA domain (Dynein-related subfamily) n=1 Tax=Hathewaya proteolytica DSM 3090 TaxID=1121331 RepID=A0A1M6NX39_9CLOT|nr:hypothetical protein [Hathewaya proteolytica]SHK00253.1 hypothetical protein SAMN02745248_01537 [Hathewaya proteolytica DSM 3090]